MCCAHCLMWGQLWWCLIKYAANDVAAAERHRQLASCGVRMPFAVDGNCNCGWHCFPVLRHAAWEPLPQRPLSLLTWQRQHIVCGSRLELQVFYMKAAVRSSIGFAIAVCLQLYTYTCVYV